jgi:hypothetical protein
VYLPPLSNKVRQIMVLPTESLVTGTQQSSSGNKTKIEHSIYKTLQTQHVFIASQML